MGVLTDWEARPQRCWIGQALIYFIVKISTPDKEGDLMCAHRKKDHYKSQLLKVKDNRLLNCCLLGYHLAPSLHLLQLGPVLEEDLFLDHPGELD